MLGVNGSIRVFSCPQQDACRYWVTPNSLDDLIDFLPRSTEKSAEDSDSDSDESPPSSPYPSRKDAILSSSFGDLPVTTVGSAPERELVFSFSSLCINLSSALFHSLAGLGGVSAEEAMTFRGVLLSPSARTHCFKKLRSPSKCRECETYVYFQGAECEKVGARSAYPLSKPCPCTYSHSALKSPLSLAGCVHCICNAVYKIRFSTV
jgi:hypothetical protein